MTPWSRARSGRSVSRRWRRHSNRIDFHHHRHFLLYTRGLSVSSCRASVEDSTLEVPISKLASISSSMRTTIIVR
jgi:hypothetical protein